MRKRASNIMTNPSGFRTIMEENIFISKDPMNRVRMLVDVLPLSVAADKVPSSLLVSPVRLVTKYLKTS
jgi:hypothetical protein